MNSEDLGCYFIKDGEIYYCIAYTDKPIVELLNINTNERKSIVCDSLLARDYAKLFKVPVGDFYDLDLVEEVKNVKSKEQCRGEDNDD